MGWARRIKLCAIIQQITHHWTRSTSWRLQTARWSTAAVASHPSSWSKSCVIARGAWGNAVNYHTWYGVPLCRSVLSCPAIHARPSGSLVPRPHLREWGLGTRLLSGERIYIRTGITSSLVPRSVPTLAPAGGVGSASGRPRRPRDYCVMQIYDVRMYFYGIGKQVWQ